MKVGGVWRYLGCGWAVVSVFAAAPAHAQERVPDPAQATGRIRGGGAAVAGADRMRYIVDTSIRLGIRPETTGPSIAGFYRERLTFLELDAAPASGPIQLDRVSQLLYAGGYLPPLDGWSLGLVGGVAGARAADTIGEYRVGFVGPGLVLNLPARGIEAECIAAPAFDTRGVDTDAWYLLDMAWTPSFASGWITLDLRYEGLGDPSPSGGAWEGGAVLHLMPNRPRSVDLALRYVSVEDQPLFSFDDDGWGFWIELQADPSSDGTGPGDSEGAAGSLLASGSLRLGLGDDGYTSRFGARAFWRAPGRNYGFHVDYCARTDVSDDPIGMFAVSLGPALEFATPPPPLEGPERILVGLEFLHRSDHALDADPGRLAASGHYTDLGSMVEHTNINIVPRLFLTTSGWHSPDLFRTADPPRWSVRLAAGYRLGTNSADPGFAGSAGLRINFLRRENLTGYLRGILGTGRETPETAAEIGLESGPWLFYLSWSDPDLDANLGDPLEGTVGIGFRL